MGCGPTAELTAGRMEAGKAKKTGRKAVRADGLGDIAEGKRGHLRTGCGCFFMHSLGCLCFPHSGGELRGGKLARC